MHKVVWIITFIALTRICGAQAPTAEELKNVPSVTLAETNKNALKYDGKFVRIKFNYRGDSPEKQRDGSLVGNLRSDGAVASAKVPREAVDWYLSLGTYDSPRSNYVYARIKLDGTDVTAELYGRELKIGLKGPELIW